MPSNDKDIRILANTLDPEEMRVAIVEGERLRELFIERMWERQKSGEIYKARVESVLPGMNASFVNLGDGRNAFLYLNDARGHDLKPGGDVVVQVTKTARKNKGARVTTRLSLPGRYLVLVPGSLDVGVSKRIEKDEERSRLRSIARDMAKRESVGVIVRTAAEGADLDVLESDFTSLLNLWNEIEKNSKKQVSPCLIYRDLGLTGRVLRDEFSERVFEIITDNDEESCRVEEWLQRYSGGINCPFSVHRGNIPLFELYGLEKEVESALDQKVWLKSGAYLVIEQTEALTVIDVNTGKFVGSSDLRNTVFRTNIEAAEEIAWQLRLRAIGGIVVVDFIDMDHEEDRRALTDRMEELFANDRCRTKVFGVTHLGLVEITRKRARADIRSILTRSCPFCGTPSRVLREDSVAVIVKRFIRKVFNSSKSEAIMLELNSKMAEYLYETYISQWQDLFDRHIALKASDSIGWDKFRLDFQGTKESLERRVDQLSKEGFVVYSTT